MKILHQESHTDIYIEVATITFCCSFYLHEVTESDQILLEHEVTGVLPIEVDT